MLLDTRKLKYTKFVLEKESIANGTGFDLLFSRKIDLKFSTSKLHRVSTIDWPFNFEKRLSAII